MWHQKLHHVKLLAFTCENIFEEQLEVAFYGLFKIYENTNPLKIPALQHCTYTF